MEEGGGEIWSFQGRLNPPSKAEEAFVGKFDQVEIDDSADFHIRR